MYTNMLIRFHKMLINIDGLNMPVKFTAFLAMFVSPLSFFIQLLILILLFDMAVSIYSQYKKKKQRCEQINKVKTPGQCFVIMFRTINPNRFVETVEKIVFYSIAIILTYVVDYIMLRQNGLDPDGRLPLASIANATYVLILGREVWSVVSKIGDITNNQIFSQIAKLIANKTGYEPQNPTQ
jgi:hypothetical protein